MNYGKLSHGVTALGVMLMMAAVAQAQGTPAAPGTSSADVGTVAPSLRERLSASYVGVLYGPAITNPTSSLQPDAMTGAADPTSPVFSKNYLSMGYKFSDTVTLSPVFYWKMHARNGSELADSYLRLANSKFLSRGNLNMSADLRVAAPMSDASQGRGLVTYLMSKQVTSMPLANRLGVSLTTYALHNFYNKPGSNVRLEVYAGPQLEYQITPTLTAGLLYEMVGHQKQGFGAFEFISGGTDLEPNLSWDITPGLNFNPWLDIKTGGRVAADTTTVGAAVTWKLL